MATARGLLSTVAAIRAPCSVKAKGKVRRPPRPAFDIANCDIKASRARGLRQPATRPARDRHFLHDPQGGDFSTTARRQTVDWSGLPCEARFWDWKLGAAKAHRSDARRVRHAGR